MSVTKHNGNEFYIGWMPQAPRTYSRHVKKVVIAIAFLVAILATILSVKQRKFSTSVFEFGQLTQVTGIYQSFPVPAIRVTYPIDSLSNEAQLTIPLVGGGKFGVDKTISQLEIENNTKLAGQKVTMTGTLLYGDGKAFLQIDGDDQSRLTPGKHDIDTVAHTIRELGTLELNGEILDPKCYFGVMKPGQGKPHRDCAIRCLAGGISPVFLVKDRSGATGYYLILDENGNRMNELLLDHVAEPVSLQARAVQHDDWIILYTSRQSIRRTGNISWVKATMPDTLSCGPMR